MAQKSGYRYFLWGIMGLLFVGLMGFGTGGFGGRITSLGTAGDKEIPLFAYQNLLRQQARAVEQQTGQPVTAQMLSESGLDRAVLNQLVTQRVLDNEVAERGLSVGDERVAEELLRVPAFQDQSGDFNRDAYRLTLEDQGIGEADFEASIRDEISRTLLQAAVVGGIPAPDPYARTLINYIGETRDVTYATLSGDDLTAPVPGPTDDDLAAYYDENGDAFLTPETRDITYAWLTPEMIQDDITLDEEALRDLYDQRINEFQQPERRLVERLIYPDADAAAEARAGVDEAGFSFETLVADRGLELSDVDMGDVSQSDLGPAGEAVFAALPGDIVGPVDTDLGPALFRVNAVLAATDVSFEDARPDLSAELANQRARRIIDQSREQIEDLIAGGATPENLAEATAMELGQITWSTDMMEGPAAYDAFRNAARTASEGDFPELVELADGGIFVLQLKGVTPPAVPQLDDVREDVAAAWSAERRQSLLLEEAESIVAQISPLTGFETLGLEPQDTDNLRRNSFVEGTVPAFIQAVFEMNPAEVRLIDNGDSAIILRLDAINAPDLEAEETAAQAQAVAAQAQQGIVQDIFEAFATAIQADTDVRLNPQAVEAVMTSGGR